MTSNPLPHAPEARPAHTVATVAVFDIFGTIHQVAAERPGRPAADRGAVAQPLGFAPAARLLRQWLAGAAFLALGAAAAVAPGHASAQTTLLNVSYDPTREFYKAFDKVFAEEWQAAGHAPIEVKSSHAGSGAQARAVIDGLDAQVVTLALAADVDAIATKTGKIPADWQGQLPHNSAPYTSTIVFLVRKGNPKAISDWGDLVKDGVQVITPNPKTSGGARWNYLAAWAWADRKFDHNADAIRDYMAALFKNVPVLDTGARGATTTFAQRGIGDVLLAWENEAYLAVEELGPDQFEIVRPSMSILAEPTVALVDGNLHDDAQREAATAYLKALYTPEAQALAIKYFYRAWDTSEADPADVARLPKLDLVTIADLGGWKKVQAEQFGDGGIFDQIYTPR